MAKKNSKWKGLQRTWVNRLGGLLSATSVRIWLGSLDMQMVGFDPTIDQADRAGASPSVIVFWHEYMLCPFAARGNTNSAILTSRHRDAEWLAESARHLGFATVRGSTNRGGSAALLEILRADNAQNLGIAPDGPLGPRRKMAPGPIYLASKLGRPVVPLGIGYDRPWRLGTWDHFAMPRPFSRARAVWGPAIDIPPNLQRDDIEHWRGHVESVLLDVTREAEGWAVDGRRRDGQRRFCYSPVARPRTSRTPLWTPPAIRWPTPDQMS